MCAAENGNKAEKGGLDIVTNEAENTYVPVESAPTERTKPADKHPETESDIGSQKEIDAGLLDSCKNCIADINQMLEYCHSNGFSIPDNTKRNLAWFYSVENTETGSEELDKLFKIHGLLCLSYSKFKTCLVKRAYVNSLINELGLILQNIREQAT